MSSRDSSSNDDEFEKISNPDMESYADSVKREDSPVMVDVTESSASSNTQSDEEVQRLRTFIEELQNKIVYQDERIFNLLSETEHLTEEMEMKEFVIKQAEEEKEDNSNLVNTLLTQLEEEKAKQAEILSIMEENNQLKEAMEKMGQMSLADPAAQVAPVAQKAPQAPPPPPEAPAALPAPESQAPPPPPPADIQWYYPQYVAYPTYVTPIPVIQQQKQDLEFEIYKYHQQMIVTNLQTQLAEYNSEVTQLKRDIEERDQKKEERKARKAEKRARDTTFYNPYEPIWKKNLTDQLKLADEQIGIIVEHNDYLRTVEANEHSQELHRLRQENEQLNSTICFLKQQLL